jgi:putative ABC transport system permease protein
MNILINVITALRAIRKNKMRSILTSFGIIIGISSVISVFGIGTSARLAVREQLFSYGKNAMLFELRSYKWITENDIKLLRESIPQIEFITPALSTPPRRSKTIHVYQGNNHRTTIWSVDRDYFPLQGRVIEKGRVFTDDEINEYGKVIIIGETVKRKLFGQENPINKRIMLNNGIYTVIGTLKPKGKAITGEDFDDVSVIPYTTGYKFFEEKSYISEILVSTKQAEDIYYVRDVIKRYFMKKYSIPDDKKYFRIATSADRLEMANLISNALTILLTGVASISLFVGGIGIMNIMLVSVTERTREIGIRMAIGAKKSDILNQFLFESIVLSVIGGLFGVIFGLGLYYAVTELANWPFIFSYVSIIVSVVFSGMVGVLFGYMPSKRAASLNPIDALRHE